MKYIRKSDGVLVSVTDDEDTVLLAVDKAPLGFVHFTWLTEQTGLPNAKVRVLMAPLSAKGLIVGLFTPSLREQELN